MSSSTVIAGFASGRRSRLASAVAALLVIGSAACEAPGPSPQRARQHTGIARAMASRAVWNPAPGDPGVAKREPWAIEQESMAPITFPNPDAAAPRALILYDVTGPWGALGELYAIGAANLVSHFGAWTAKPAIAYDCGELAGYEATIYLGSTYDEPLPDCLLDDVLGGDRPVVWAFYNLWQLTARAGYDAFVGDHGFYWTSLDFSPIGSVEYRGHELARYRDNPGGVLATYVIDQERAQVLATARREDGSTLPWALRSGNLTYVSELPFTYMSEEDRYLVFADMLFDLLAPETPERHRAVVRLEDITPVDDPDTLRAVADYLYGEGIPFGFGVISEYRDPLGVYNDGVGERVRLRQAPEMVDTLAYLASRGGVMVMHGYTHQWDGGLNPYTEVSGDDTEFYRVIENEDHTLTYAGPLPEDSVRWASRRIRDSFSRFRRAGLAAPTIFELPHYAGSASSYRAAADSFSTRWERALYFPGVLHDGQPDYRWMFGQLFPYSVRDVYGTRVLPENLGNIEPEPFYIYPARFPEDIIAAAEKNLVVRDGVAAFYFHAFFDIAYLEETVDGLRALGYTFVSPDQL